MLRRRYIKLEKMYHLNRCLPLFTLGNEMNIAILDLKIFKNKDINSTKIRNKTTRLLNKLKLHGIIKKVNHSSKYYLTTKGRKIANSILLFKNIDLPYNYV